MNTILSRVSTFRFSEISTVISITAEADAPMLAAQIIGKKVDDFNISANELPLKSLLQITAGKITSKHDKIITVNMTVLM